jgi:hypothetical protein
MQEENAATPAGIRFRRWINSNTRTRRHRLWKLIVKPYRIAIATRDEDWAGELS